MANPNRRESTTVKDLVPSDVLVQHLKATTKRAAIQELVNALAIHGVIDLSREREVLDAMLERERVASTGIGNGMAIPHGKNKHADRLGVAVGLSEEGIDFAAHDGQPAHVVVLWICPPAATPEHLALMRALAGVAREPDHTKRLAKARDRRQFLAVLGDIEVETKGK